jgi:glyoxylase-like metal-dependent hydrolase (beta-lactamase superfamily II)
MSAWWRCAGLLLAVWIAGSAQAADVRFDRVADGVYAFVGELGPRTRDNEGLNANLGLVITPQGAVLIDSGASWQGAQQIEAAVRRVTTQPVRWVVNTGGQDHRWLGNGWFASRGAELIAHAAGEADFRNRGGDQLAALQAVLGDRAAGTVPTLPTRWLRGPDERLVLGGMVFEFRHRGGAHTPGDMLVWLPAQRVLFSGDVVYVDRMLGVLPVSSTKAWLASFAEIEALAPAHIVPGHGAVTDLARARAHTRDLLLALRKHMQAAVEAGTDVSEAVRRFDAAPFAALLNAAELMPGNASRVYLEVERE